MGALRPEGRDLALQSTAQGQVDIVWGADGNPEFDDSEEWRVTKLLMSRLGEWWADDSGRRGSRLHTVKQDKRGLTQSLLETYAKEALRVAEEGRYITVKTVKATRLGGGLYQLLVQWLTPSGRPGEKRYQFQG